ncbi:hypothetical protein GOBAR_DD24029 [Gossypium barbadense]|nr:hypothetical protein GOBAR_DD24029 [Gossypium barbadense]
MGIVFLEQKLVGQKVDSGGLYRLLQCASKGDKASVIQELDKGVEPNGADYDRRTALHLAACEGWIEVVDLLLEKGADVNSLDHWGRTVGVKGGLRRFDRWVENCNAHNVILSLRYYPVLLVGHGVNSQDPLSDAHSFRHNEVCKILEA